MDAEVLLVVVVPTVKKLLKQRHYVVVVVPLEAVVLIKEELPISEQEFFEGAVDAAIGDERKKDGFDQVFDVKMDRRSAFKKLTASLLIGAGAVSSCTSVSSE